MVSQSSSVGYTIMGKTADLTVVQKTTIDTLHKEGKTQKVMQKRLAVHRALSPSTLIERRREGKDVVEKSVQAIGITAPWRGLWNKTHSKMWGRFTKSGLQLESVLQEPLRADVCKTWVFSCRIPCVKPLLNNRQRQKRLDWTAAEWSKVMFSDERNFAFPLEIRVPESGGREERHRIHVAWGPV